jgi:hypothetical protein
MSDTRVWPDDLELDDRVKFDGNEYIVVGTGPAEATLERVDNDDNTIEVFRWAFTDSVGLELKTSMSQEEFGRSVDTDTDRDEEVSS